MRVPPGASKKQKGSNDAVGQNLNIVDTCGKGKHKSNSIKGAKTYEKRTVKKNKDRTIEIYTMQNININMATKNENRNNDAVLIQI